MQEFWRPPLSRNSAGEPRRVGFELEFGNLTVKETAEALHRSLGGDLRENNPFSFVITDSAIGDLKVERDAELLNSVEYRKALQGINIDFDPDTLANEIELGLDKLSSFLIPCEVVTEPLLFRRLPKLNEIVRVLNSLRAKGTQASILFAFGLHINPSVPDLEDATLVTYMQSFLLLTDWIIENSGVDFSRRFLTNFIDPFPEPYVGRVLEPGYKPTAAAFIDDYLEFNPTRNRALDMLPVLCEIDNQRVLAGVKAEERSLTSGRPAFHYRLPDCRLGDQRWFIADEWNRWWHVEAIAADNSLLAELIDLWGENSKRLMVTRKKQWVGTVKNFLNRHITAPGHSS